MSDGYPLVLALPNGVRAQLVIGSGKADAPRYEVDGAAIDVDVRIPADLTGRWFWHGSFLRMRTEPGKCGLSIDSGTYPPPDWPAVRGSCFDAARRVEAASAAIHADLAEVTSRRAKKTRRSARDVRELLREIPDRITAKPEPALQLEMEL